MSTVDQLLFEGIRRVVREEVRAALHDHGPPSEPIVLAETEYLSVAEAADLARLHHSTIRQWIKEGSLKAYRAGRVYRIRRDDLQAKLTSKPAEPTDAMIKERVAAILAKRGLRAA